MKFLIAAIMLMIAGVVNAADSPDFPVYGTRLDKDKTKELIKYALENTRYGHKIKFRKLPKLYVDVVDEALWDSELCGDEPGCGLLGYYKEEEGNVVHVRSDTKLIRADINFLGSVEGIIVHEIGHWVRRQAGYNANMRNCAEVAANEGEMYTLSYLYDTEVKGLSYKWFMSDIWTSCNNYWRPRPLKDEPFGVVAEPVITK